MTVGEIRKGIESIRRRDFDSAAVLECWLQRLVNDHGDRILAIDGEVAEEWRRLNVPDPVPTVDSLIGATAKVHGLAVATRNVGEMSRTGAHLLDPFR